MGRTRDICIGLVVSALLVTGLSIAGQKSQSPVESGIDVEEVFVYVAARSNRTPGDSDPACNSAGFTVRNRNDYDLLALSLKPGDTKLDPKVGEIIGRSVSCFGPRSESGKTDFFAILTINRINVSGRGECTQRYRDFPEPRVSVQDCWLKLEKVPNEYVGGFVTINANATGVVDQAAASTCVGGPCGRGLESDPPGYVLPAVATVRLWRGHLR